MGILKSKNQITIFFGFYKYAATINKTEMKTVIIDKKPILFIIT